MSFLLVLVVTNAWIRTAEDLRPRWWLVPVTWVWATLHGMWPVGAVIGSVALIGIALDNWPRRRELRPVLLRLLAVPVLSLAAAALTPVGPGLYSAVLLVGGRAKFHDEWGPTNFHEFQAAVVGALIVVTLLVWLFARGEQRPDWVSVLLTALVPFTADRPASVPSWVNPALDRLPDGTTVQTTGVMGGYVLWRHPELNPVIDGYSDAYTTRHLQEQLDWTLKRFQGWKVLHTSHDVVMLEAPEGWGS